MKAGHSLSQRLSDAKGFVCRLQKVADLLCTDMPGEIKNGTRQETIGSGDDWDRMLRLSHWFLQCRWGLNIPKSNAYVILKQNGLFIDSFITLVLHHERKQQCSDIFTATVRVTPSFYLRYQTLMFCHKLQSFIRGKNYPRTVIFHSGQQMLGTQNFINICSGYLPITWKHSIS